MARWDASDREVGDPFAVATVTWIQGWMQLRGAITILFCRAGRRASARLLPGPWRLFFAAPALRNEDNNKG